MVSIVRLTALCLLVVASSVSTTLAGPIAGAGDTSYGDGGRARPLGAAPTWEAVTALPIRGGGAYVYDRAPGPSRGARSIRVAKLDPMGRLDRSWGDDGIATTFALDAQTSVLGAVDGSGGLVLATTRQPSLRSEGFVARFDSTGHLDVARSVTIPGPWTTTALAIGGDGRIHVAGSLDQGRAVVRSIAPSSATVDATWGADGQAELVVEDGLIGTMAAGPDASLLVAYTRGRHSYEQFLGSGLARIDGDGRVDTSYGYAPSAAPRPRGFDTGAYITAIHARPGRSPLVAVSANRMMVSAQLWPPKTGFATLSPTGRPRLTSSLRFDESVTGFQEIDGRLFAVGHVEFAGLGAAPSVIALDGDGHVDTTWGDRGSARPVFGNGVDGRTAPGITLAAGRSVTRVLVSGPRAHSTPKLAYPPSCQRVPGRPWAAVLCAWQPGERLPLQVSGGTLPRVQTAYAVPQRPVPARPWIPKRAGGCRTDRVVDAIGAKSSWVEACVARTRQERSFRANGEWTPFARRSALGGRVLRTSTPGATASIDTLKLVPSGYRIDLTMALVFTTCPTCGRVVITSDTGMRTVVSLKSKRTVARRQVFLETYGDTDSGPLGTRITVRTMDSGRVELDGIAWVPSETFGTCEDPYASINSAGFCYEVNGI